jgi:hypothetical protein
MADFSDGVADTPDDMADSPGDRQAGIDLPLSALQAGAKEETQVKKDAATTTRKQAGPSSSAAVGSSSSPSTKPNHLQLKGEVKEQLMNKVCDWFKGKWFKKEEKWFKEKREWLKNKMKEQV